MEQHNDQGVILVEAAVQGDIAEVRLLLSYRVDVDADFHGYTALYQVIASRQGEFIEVVHVLLEAGADPNKTQGNSYSQTTPLGLAAGESLTAIVALLLKAGANVDAACALHIAATRGNVEILKMLIDAGGDVGLYEEDSEQGNLPIDVFELSLASRRRNNKPLPTEENIREVRALLAV